MQLARHTCISILKHTGFQTSLFIYILLYLHLLPPQSTSTPDLLIQNLPIAPVDDTYGSYSFCYSYGPNVPVYAFIKK